MTATSAAESIELLKQADIVVTIPPFSLFREYVAQLIEHDKKFIIIGNMNAVSGSPRAVEASAMRIEMAEKRKKYDREFCEEAVRIVEETGRLIAQVARDLA